MRVTTSSSKSIFIISDTSQLEFDRLTGVLGAKRSPVGTLFLPLCRAYFYRLQSLTRDLLEVDESVVRQLHLDRFDEKEFNHPRWDDLYYFQKDAIQSFFQSDRNRLISLSPGLGKTIVSILIHDLLKSRRTLVVAPLILLKTWKSEIESWSCYDQPIQVYRGEGKVATSGWVITNFEQVARHPERFKSKWDFGIVDESIRLKSRDAKRSKALHGLAPLFNRRVLLSGIPITRDVSDLWSPFKFLDSKLFSSFWRFAHTYCYVVRGTWGEEILGSRSDIDFEREFSDLMFTRRSEEVLNLPPIISRRIHLDLPDGPQKTVYKKAEKEFKLLLETGQEIPIATKLVQLNRLQQILSNLSNTQSGEGSIKLTALLDLLDNDEIELPLLIWGFWKKGLRAIYAALIGKGYRVGLLTGDTQETDREILLHQYKTGLLDIFILSYPVGKYGLTLTNTKTVLPYDKVFGLDDIGQTVYRTQRIGLDHSVVSISLEVDETIDEYIGDNLVSKLSDLDTLKAGDVRTILSFIGK